MQPIGWPSSTQHAGTVLHMPSSGEGKLPPPQVGRPRWGSAKAAAQAEVDIISARGGRDVQPCGGTNSGGTGHWEGRTDNGVGSEPRTSLADASLPPSLHHPVVPENCVGNNGNEPDRCPTPVRRSEFRKRTEHLRLEDSDQAMTENQPVCLRHVLGQGLFDQSRHGQEIWQAM